MISNGGLNKSANLLAFELLEPATEPEKESPAGI
jgi:hypothetical protein